MGKYNGKLLSNAHTLRKNMTKEERHLWYDFLKSYPCHVYKQRIIGNYIVDFYCPSAKLIIELDGSQHYEDEGREKDNIRSNYLESLGLKIIRIPNNEISRNFRGVCEYIDEQIRTSQSPDGDSSLRREQAPDLRKGEP